MTSTRDALRLQEPLREGSPHADPMLDAALDRQAEEAWVAYVKAVAVNELRRPPHRRMETLPWYVRLACWVWTRGWQRKPGGRP